MSTLLVSYQLSHASRDYDTLRKALESTGSYWHYLDSTWLVDTDESPEQLRDRLSGVLDRRDRVLVVQVGPQAVAWSGFGRDAHEWLDSELP